MSYREIVHGILELDKSITSATIANLQNLKVLATHYKEEEQEDGTMLPSLSLTRQESELLIIQSLIRMSTRTSLEHKFGKVLYSSTVYENVITVSTYLFNHVRRTTEDVKENNSDDTPVLLLSFDKNADHELIISSKVLPYLKKQKIADAMPRVYKPHAKSQSLKLVACNAMSQDFPKWQVSGDWFDLCNCNIPCPCNFGHAPTHGECAGVLAWHIDNGHYYGGIGDDDVVRLDGLNFIMVGSFKGNLWDGTASDMAGGFFIDERANKRQRDALQTIFGGRAGGFPAQFTRLFSQLRGTEFVPIRFEVAEDLAYWSVDIPGKVVAKAEALSAPQVPPGKRVQTFNSPEVMADAQTGIVPTWGKTAANEVEAFGFKWNLAGRSSKHIPFDWAGP